MKDLIIVGAGSQGREALQFAKDINNIKPTWNIKGFIADWGDDIPALTNNQYKILGTISEWKPSKNEVYICAINQPVDKRIIVQKLLAKGATFTNLIHPSTGMSDYVKIGTGCIFYPHSGVGNNCTIGNFVTLSGVVAHDNILEDFVTLSGGACTMGHVTVKEAAFLGAKCVIAPDIKIGEESFVGIGSVVVRNVKPKTKVFGNPARVLDI